MEPPSAELLYLTKNIKKGTADFADYTDLFNRGTKFFNARDAKGARDANVKNGVVGFGVYTDFFLCHRGHREHRGKNLKIKIQKMEPPSAG